MDKTYVSQSECEERRRDIDEKLLKNSLKIVELETTLKQLVNTNRMTLGALISGMVTIITILLTRGI